MSASDDLSVTDQANEKVDSPGGLLRTIPTAQEPCLQAAPQDILQEKLATIRSNITRRELFAAQDSDSVETEDKDPDLRAGNRNISTMSDAGGNDTSVTINRMKGSVDCLRDSSQDVQDR